MNGKIYPIGDVYMVQDIDTSKKYVVRIEDSDLPYVVGSAVVFGVNKEGFAIINQCETIAEIHTSPIGWICPKCNKSNAPFIKKCDC
jgi:hypothetical protein